MTLWRATAGVGGKEKGRRFRSDPEPFKGPKCSGPTTGNTLELPAKQSPLAAGLRRLAIVWLEALGFCKHGEGGQFIEGGKRIALDGELPLNTNRGQLSAGRLHGYGLLHEACLQLWGAAGERQVAGPPEVAVVGVGGGPLGGCLLLTR